MSLERHVVFLKAGFHSHSRSYKSAYDPVKIKKGSCEQSHKLDGIGIRRIRMFPFSCHSAYHSVAYNLLKTAMSESEAEAEE